MIVRNAKNLWYLNTGFPLLIKIPSVAVIKREVIVNIPSKIVIGIAILIRSF